MRILLLMLAITCGACGDANPIAPTPRPEVKPLPADCSFVRVRNGLMLQCPPGTPGL